VEGIADAEAAAPPVQLDAEMLSRAEISTWRTDAGDFDVLVNIPDREGRRQGYEDLTRRGRRLEHAGVKIRVAGLDDIVASKEWANRPKDREALPELYGLRDQAQGRRPPGLPGESAPSAMHQNAAHCGFGGKASCSIAKSRPPQSPGMRDHRA
jgi:hypothetical protein